jgi:hypothetical protein
VSRSGFSCAQCGELLMVVLQHKTVGTHKDNQGEPVGEFVLIVRPRRITRCCKYQPGFSDLVCQAEGVTTHQALAAFINPGHGPRRGVI